MATYTNAYEKLYENVKNHFTVADYNCTLGEYMLIKAKEKNASTSLPVSMQNNNTISAVISFVNDKLTIKNPPAKDKTIKAFPFRASAAAMLSAFITCGLIFTYGMIASSSVDTPSYIVEADVESENSESSQYTIEAHQ